MNKISSHGFALQEKGVKGLKSAKGAKDVMTAKLLTKGSPGQREIIAFRVRGDAPGLPNQRRSLVKRGRRQSTSWSGF